MPVTCMRWTPGTGAKLWSYATGKAGFSSPSPWRTVWYIACLGITSDRPTGQSNIYALNASTGALLWSYATGNSVNPSPAVANGVVYFGSEAFPTWATMCTR